MVISDIERRQGLTIERRRSKAPRLPTPTEEVTHRAVVAHLERRAVPGLLYWHTPNGELRRPAAGGRLRAMGSRAGIPDLLLMRAGQLYALELKRDGGRVSDAQREAMAELSAAGAIVAVAYGLDEALAQLTAWGLLR